MNDTHKVPTLSMLRRERMIKEMELEEMDETINEMETQYDTILASGTHTAIAEVHRALSSAVCSAADPIKESVTIKGKRFKSTRELREHRRVTNSILLEMEKEDGY